MFKSFWEYLQQWLGGQMIYFDSRYTSQTCSACHNVCKDNRQTQAVFVCIKYKYLEHADLMGIKNILEWESWVAKLCEAGTRSLIDKLESTVV